MIATLVGAGAFDFVSSAGSNSTSKVRDQDKHTVHRGDGVPNQVIEQLAGDDLYRTANAGGSNTEMTVAGY